MDMGILPNGLLGLMLLLGTILALAVPDEGGGDGGSGGGGGNGDGGGDGGQGGDPGKPPADPPAPAAYQIKLTDAQRERLIKDGTLDLSEEQYTGGVRTQIDTLRRRATTAEKRLGEIAAAQEESERKALEEQEKFKELYEKERQARENETAGRKDDLICSRFLLSAQSKGAVDPDTAFLVARGLAGFATVQVGDDGAVTGIDELVDALKSAKPYLFSSGDPQKRTVGGPSNPGNQPPTEPKTLAEAGDELERRLRAGI